MGLKQFTNQYAPEMLLGAGFAGFGLTVVEAAKASPHAAELIANSEDERGERLKFVDKVKLVWKDYIGTASLAAVTAGCFIGSYKIQHTRIAKANKKYIAAASSLAMAESVGDIYRRKVKEVLGEEKEKEIAREARKEEEVQRSTIIAGGKIQETGSGTVLYYLPLTGSIFRAGPGFVDDALVQLNIMYVNHEEEGVSFNDYTDLLGIAPSDIGKDYGWCSTVDRQKNYGHLRALEYKFGSTIVGSEPAVVIRFSVDPRYDYQDDYSGR